MSLHAGRILVIDDEPPIRRLLRTILQAHDYEVIDAATADEGIALAASRKPDAVILDLGLPDRDGMEVIHAIRPQSAVPILVLSSRSDESGKVAALDAGADDYVSKPFGAEELMARIRATLRHRLRAQGAPPVFVSGGLSVDLVHRLVNLDNQPVKLSPKEYAILAQLILHAGKVLTHKHLLREVWGNNAGADVQYLRVFIRQLRQKLETDPELPTLIVTESGVGYRLRQASTD